MFSSIVATAFQRLAAVDIQHRYQEEDKRSGEEDEIAHDTPSRPAARIDSSAAGTHLRVQQRHL
jgi:hypothetical protein